jgi:membrane protease YdiL (CAAX protease family)
MILLILGGAEPSIVGIGMVFLTYDREARKDFWLRCISPGRIRFPWWLVILLIFPVLYAAGIGLDLAAGGAMPGMEQLRDLIAHPLSVPLALLMSFLSGPLAEEFGWRGYALDPILRRSGPFRGSIVLGVL